MRILLALLSLFLFLPASAGKEVRVYKGDSRYQSDILFTVRDGKVYKTVTFTFNGITQTWMAENLTYSSATITPVLDSASIVSLKADQEQVIIQNELRDLPEWFYTFDSTYWNSLVRYKWYEAMGLDSSLVAADSGNVNFEKVLAIVDSIENEKGYYQGLCPNGWRLPTAEDWNQLIDQCYRLIPEIGFGPVTVENFIIRPEIAETSYAPGEMKLHSMWFFENLKWDWGIDRTFRVNEMMTIRCIKE